MSFSKTSTIEKQRYIIAWTIIWWTCMILGIGIGIIMIGIAFLVHDVTIQYDQQYSIERSKSILQMTLWYKEACNKQDVHKAISWIDQCDIDQFSKDVKREDNHQLINVAMKSAMNLVLQDAKWIWIQETFHIDRRLFFIYVKWICEQRQVLFPWLLSMTTLLLLLFLYRIPSYIQNNIIREKKYINKSITEKMRVVVPIETDQEEGRGEGNPISYDKNVHD